MKLFKTPNCMEYVADVPEQIPDYYYFKQFHKEKHFRKKNKTQIINQTSNIKLDKLKFQLNNTYLKSPDNESKQQLNKKINTFYQQFRDQQMKGSLYPNKIHTYKKNINFNKGTLSLVQSTNETRLQLQKQAEDYAKGKLKKDTEEQAKRNLLTDKILMKFKDQIFLIYENQHIFENLCKNYQFLNKSEFYEILKIIGLKNENKVYDKVFWIFDIDGNEIIELSDIKYGCQKFTEQVVEQQVKIFFDLCDQKKEGFLDQTKIFHLLQSNLKKVNDKVTLAQNINEFMGMIKCKNINNILKKELKESCLIHKNLWDIINQNISGSKIKKQKFQQDINLDDQINQNYSLTIPYFEKVYHYIKENETMIENYAKLKQDFQKRIQQQQNLFLT